MQKILIYSSLLGIFTFAGQAIAASDEYNLEIKSGGGFSPATLEIPKDQKVKLVVKNNDKVEAEFESYQPKREEKIKPGDKTEIYVGPLEAGQYPFFDDNNPDARGTLVAK